MHKGELMTHLKAIIASPTPIVQKRSLVRRLIETEPIDELVEALLDLAVIYWHMSRTSRIRGSEEAENSTASAPESGPDGKEARHG